MSHLLTAVESAWLAPNVGITVASRSISTTTRLASAGISVAAFLSDDSASSSGITLVSNVPSAVHCEQHIFEGCAFAARQHLQAAQVLKGRNAAPS